jgi:REP element-mobilizing transposase RayT
MNFTPVYYSGRHSIRLKGYDYAQAGGYFVTIVTQGRECFFGEIHNDKMILNDAGRMVKAAWEALPQRFPNIGLDIFKVMPNHLHGIVVIHDDPVVPALSSRATTRVAPTLGDIVGAFKSITTHEYIRGVDESNWPQFYKRLWQRNFYEHIIRDQPDYERIARYIADNPSNWAEDEENPALSACEGPLRPTLNPVNP